MSNKKNIYVNNVLLISLTVLFCTQSVVAKTQSLSVLKVTSEGRKPGSDLKYRSAGVPVFDMIQKQGSEVIRIKNIPQLDIGEEKQVQAEQLDISIPDKSYLKVSEMVQKPSPPLVEIPQNVNFAPAESAPKKIVSQNVSVTVPVVNALAYVPEPVVTDTKPFVQNLIEVKPEEYKMLQALIFLEYQKKYDLAMALFVELMDVPQYRAQAMYHYAETARGLKMGSEFRQKMIQVTTETKDKELKKMAVESLIKNISDLQISDIGLIEPLAEAFDIDTTFNTAYLLKKAKYYSEKGNLGEFESALAVIPVAAPEYKEATLLKAVFNYRQGQVDDAIENLESLWPMVESNRKDSVRNLAALTLARIYFQKGEYKSAYKNYLNIDKSSGQWLQGMVEQAWTQVLAGDNEGAAGNMFSMHTDFFKKAYSPETYIVRTVSYLNLCQYGDGLSVLDDLKKKYSSINNKLKNFQSTNKESMKYYDLVKLWMKNTNLEEIDGVPRSFIVELARHPSYMLTQQQINNYEDENSRFNKVAIDLIRKERATRLEMLKAKNELAAAKRDGKKDITSLEKKFLAVGVEQVIYSRARDGIKKMREAAIARIGKEETALRIKAANTLQNRYQLYTASLDHLIDQKEVLAYEIYSGAGEHLRYQMAGGEIKDRTAANINPTEKDSYSWKHKGEVWEDEIGHYRSALKNVCPAEDLAQNAN
jgi:hypothetical protein